jgi:hypothetical protein
MPTTRLADPVSGYTRSGSGLTQETEPGLLDELCLTRQRIAAEEDRGTEDPLKGSDRSTVLLAAGMHAEVLEHFRGSAKPAPQCLNKTIPQAELRRSVPLFTMTCTLPAADISLLRVQPAGSIVPQPR